jgi:hypothetical protein
METETNTYAERLAAFDEAQAALAATPTTELLQLAYRLTHQLDAYGRRECTTRADRQHAGTRISDLRQQRDMITAEVLRRADGTTLSVVRS